MTMNLAIPAGWRNSRNISASDYKELSIPKNRGKSPAVFLIRKLSLRARAILGIFCVKIFKNYFFERER